VKAVGLIDPNGFAGRRQRENQEILIARLWMIWYSNSYCIFAVILSGIVFSFFSTSVNLAKMLLQAAFVGISATRLSNLSIESIWTISGLKDDFSSRIFFYSSLTINISAKPYSSVGIATTSSLSRICLASCYC
jgi:hypothetical protein